MEILNFSEILNLLLVLAAAAAVAGFMAGLLGVGGFNRFMGSFNLIMDSLCKLKIIAS